MNKCCGKCDWYKFHRGDTGNCTWVATNPPFWAIVYPTLVVDHDGSDCLAFVPVKEET
jgi:hypothetical protein